MNMNSTHHFVLLESIGTGNLGCVAVSKEFGTVLNTEYWLEGSNGGYNIST